MLFVWPQNVEYLGRWNIGPVSHAFFPVWMLCTLPLTPQLNEAHEAYLSIFGHLSSFNTNQRNKVCIFPQKLRGHWGWVTPLIFSGFLRSSTLVPLICKAFMVTVFFGGPPSLLTKDRSEKSICEHFIAVFWWSKKIVAIFHFFLSLWSHVMDYVPVTSYVWTSFSTWWWSGLHSKWMFPPLICRLQNDKWKSDWMFKSIYSLY